MSSRLWIVVVIALGCGKTTEDPPPPPVPIATPTPAAPPNKLSRATEVIARTHSTDAKIARNANIELGQMQPPWNADEGLEILGATCSHRR